MLLIEGGDLRIILNMTRSIHWLILESGNYSLLKAVGRHKIVCMEWSSQKALGVKTRVRNTSCTNELSEKVNNFTTHEKSKIPMMQISISSAAHMLNTAEYRVKQLAQTFQRSISLALAWLSQEINLRLFWLLIHDAAVATDGLRYHTVSYSASLVSSF